MLLAVKTRLLNVIGAFRQTGRDTKNRATDREQFIKSNAATARPLILVRPAEI